MQIIVFLDYILLIHIVLLIAKDLLKLSNKKIKIHCILEYKVICHINIQGNYLEGSRHKIFVGYVKVGILRSLIIFLKLVVLLKQNLFFFIYNLKGFKLLTWGKLNQTNNSTIKECFHRDIVSFSLLLMVLQQRLKIIPMNKFQTMFSRILN